MTRTAAAAMLLFASLCLAGTAQPPPAADYLYRAQAHDTLIGLSRRLLKDPRQWPALQKRNAIANPTRIPVGTAILIPRDWLRASLETAAVTLVVGKATGDGTQLATGDLLHEGEKIATDAGAYVTVTLADGSVVTLNSASTLEMESLKRYDGTGRRDTRLRLREGRLETRVKPQGDAGRFQIRTPVALSAVRGTEFRRAFVGPDALDTTEVIGGSVGVAGASGSAAASGSASTAGNPGGVLVPAGYGTVSDADSGPRAPVKLLPPPILSEVPARFEDESVRVAFAPVEGARAYHAYIASDSDFHSVVAEATSEIPALVFSGLPDARYFLRVRSRDSQGLEGTDAVREFERHRLLPPPQADEPRADAFVTGDGTSFRWTAVDGAAAYQFQLAQDPAFSRIVTERGRMSETALNLAPMGPGIFYWRVGSIDRAGNPGRWGSGQRYTLKRPPGPPPPVLNPKSIDVSWTGEPGQRFRLQIARDAQFQQIVEDQQLDSPHATVKPLSAGAYYLRVKATDPDGYEGPYSPPRKFAVPLPWWVKLAPILLVIPFL